MKINSHECIVFIGDSITDSRRDKFDSCSLGDGYVRMINQEIQKLYPTYDIKVINRGVGGNRVEQLLERLDSDCLNLQPDIVSILVGINDTWHTLDQNDFGHDSVIRIFKYRYETIIKRLLYSGIKRIVLVEPFLLGHASTTQAWRKDFDPKIQVIRQLATTYQLEFLSLDGYLNELSIKDGFLKYADSDGIHPTKLGHEEISKRWLSKVVINNKKIGE